VKTSTLNDSDIWQTLRSEIEGQLVAQHRDEWGWLHVVDHGDCRYLYFGAPYEQTCIRKDKPHQLVHEYARAMSLAFALAQPRDAILLGLGGGSLLHALQKACPDANTSVVEMRPQVAVIAREYFQLDSLRDGQLIIADAKQQLRLFPTESCDLLLADLFYDNRMHPWQEQQKFFLQCRKLLRPDGWLAINFDAPRLVDSESCYPLADLFPTLLSVTTRDDNQIVLASPQSRFDIEDHLPAIEQLEQQLEIPLRPLLKNLREHP
jgi:spermidine synthase